MRARLPIIFVLAASVLMLTLFNLNQAESIVAAQSLALQKVQSELAIPLAPNVGEGRIAREPAVAQFKSAPLNGSASTPEPISTPEPAAFAQLNPGVAESVQSEGPALIAEDARVAVALQNAPLMFVENVGQFDAGARFQVRRGDTVIHLAKDALWFTILESAKGQESALKGVHLKLSFPGADPAARLVPFDRLQTRVSYFIGSDATNWRSDVPAWGGVRYEGLYTGLDLEITSEGGHWAWRLVCRADCDSNLSKVNLRADGANDLELDEDALRLQTPIGDFILPLLQIVAADGAPLSSLTGEPRISHGIVQNPFKSLAPMRVISPQGIEDLVYGTYLGGSGKDVGKDVAVDGDGDAYVVGATASGDFPHTTGAFSATLGGGNDAFVAKVHPGGEGANDLIYATFMGGPSDDYAAAVAVDDGENAYVTGYSHSFFPETAGSFGACDGSGAYVVKLNPAGSDIVYGGCLKGINAAGQDLALDSAGQAYVTGETGATFPTTAGAYDEVHNGNNDAFVTVVSSDGVTLTYSSYLGGGDHECKGAGRGCTLAVDEEGSDVYVYVTGGTASLDFPTTAGAYDESCGTDGACNGRLPDGFVVKLKPEGNGTADMVYGTYIGGSGADNTSGIAVDGNNNAYVTGSTASSTDFPVTSGSFDEGFNGGYEDAFVAKLNAAGSVLRYAGYLGGSAPGDHGWDIAVSDEGVVYAVGHTNSSDFPVTGDAFDAHLGGVDTYVVKLNPNGSELLYATFLGGENGSDSGNGCALAVDGAGNVYVAGDTNADDFPTSVGAYDRTYNEGVHDVFMVRLPTDRFRVYLPLTIRTD